jgi:hypothetical protein
MIEIDPALLEDFERALVPERPGSVAGRARIVGHGEISTVFLIASRPDLVVKRMAGFTAPAEAERYRAGIDEYCALLRERGIDVLETASVPVTSRRGAPVVYLVQPAVDPRRIGNALLREAGDGDLRALLRAIFERMAGVWARNGGGAGTSADGRPLVGLDAQLSNWAWEGAGRLRYLDVSTPFVRRRGRELLDPEPGLRSLPPPVAWAVRRFVLRGVIDRYYDLREVAKDIVANFFKEGRRDRIPLALDEVNRWLGKVRPGAAPLAESEVARYYALDERIWKGFLALRRLHRAIQSRVMGLSYEYVLPEPERAAR